MTDVEREPSNTLSRHSVVERRSAGVLDSPPGRGGKRYLSGGHGIIRPPPQSWLSREHSLRERNEMSPEFVADTLAPLVLFIWLGALCFCSYSATLALT